MRNPTTSICIPLRRNDNRNGRGVTPRPITDEETQLTHHIKLLSRQPSQSSLECQGLSLCITLAEEVSDSVGQ